MLCASPALASLPLSCQQPRHRQGFDRGAHMVVERFAYGRVPRVCLGTACRGTRLFTGRCARCATQASFYLQLVGRLHSSLRWCPRCAAVLCLDGYVQYTDGPIAPSIMERFQQRCDNQITTLEIVAISLGLSTFASELAHRNVIVYSDNKGAEGAVRNGTSRAWDQAKLIHEIWTLVTVSRLVHHVWALLRMVLCAGACARHAPLDRACGIGL